MRSGMYPRGSGRFVQLARVDEYNQEDLDQALDTVRSVQVAEGHRQPEYWNESA